MDWQNAEGETTGKYKDAEEEDAFQEFIETVPLLEVVQVS